MPVPSGLSTELAGPLSVDGTWRSFLELAAELLGDELVEEVVKNESDVDGELKDVADIVEVVITSD